MLQHSYLVLKNEGVHSMHRMHTLIIYKKVHHWCSLASAFFTLPASIISLLAIACAERRTSEALNMSDNVGLFQFVYLFA